ncbi:MAG: hypothetical protein GX569_02470, partial [Candidatus Riflebacteria bacterium]|nr:hypothetical protein [Candidatus Riflebacteria bacterium]
MQKCNQTFFLTIFLFILFIANSSISVAQENSDFTPWLPDNEGSSANILLNNASSTTLTTIASFTPLSPSNFIESYISNEYFINLSSTVRILIAPNPTGPNLAPLAAPSASSIWPVPTYNFDGTIALHIPAHANDENRNTYWSSHYGDGSQ